MSADLEIFDFFNVLNKKCSKTTKHFFKKGQTITTYTENRNQMCFLR